MHLLTSIELLTLKFRDWVRWTYLQTHEPNSLGWWLKELILQLQFPLGGTTLEEYSWPFPFPSLSWGKGGEVREVRGGRELPGELGRKGMAHSAQPLSFSPDVTSFCLQRCNVLVCSLCCRVNSALLGWRAGLGNRRVSSVQESMSHLVNAI